METPQKERTHEKRPKYTEEDKRQLLANLDIEVAHRTRQFEASLADMLENFLNHHEGQVLRVPRLVRGVTMAEFGDKYNGDINECLRGLQKERHGGEPVAIDASVRKRKWQASQDGPGPDEAESSRAVKNARLQATPKKQLPSSLRTSRVLKTPGTTRTVRLRGLSPSPTKAHAPMRPSSPSKPSSSRLPSALTFNPHLPKTPAYPRPPRKNERLMSINGSPLAISHQHGYFGEAIDEEEEGADNEQSSLGDRRIGKRASTIIVRRDPSFSFAPQPNGRIPLSRNTSHSSLATASQPTTNSQSHSQPRSQPSSSQLTQHSSSSSVPSHPPSSQSFSQASAVVRVPTRDGHLLEFDPLLTSPDELEALQEITASAKKQAKEDMTRLVHAALAKWKI